MLSARNLPCSLPSFSSRLPAGSPRDRRPRSPSTPHRCKAALLQTHFQENDPRLNLDKHNTSQKETAVDIWAPAPKAALAQPPANALCDCAP